MKSLTLLFLSTCITSSYENNLKSDFPVLNKASYIADLPLQNKFTLGAYLIFCTALLFMYMENISNLESSISAQEYFPQFNFQYWKNNFNFVLNNLVIIPLIFISFLLVLVSLRILYTAMFSFSWLILYSITIFFLLQLTGPFVNQELKSLHKFLSTTAYIFACIYILQIAYYVNSSNSITGIKNSIQLALIVIMFFGAFLLLNKGSDMYKLVIFYLTSYCISLLFLFLPDLLMLGCTLVSGYYIWFFYEEIYLSLENYLDLNWNRFIMTFLLFILLSITSCIIWQSYQDMLYIFRSLPNIIFIVFNLYILHRKPHIRPKNNNLLLENQYVGDTGQEELAS